MNELLTSNLSETSPLSTAQAALRDLYRTARHIPYHASYAAARLARIADQAEYFLHAWPADLWPTHSQTDWPIPTKEVLLAWLASAKKEANQHLPPTNRPWTYAAWSQITTTLLAALVPLT